VERTWELIGDVCLFLADAGSLYFNPVLAGEPDDDEEEEDSKNKNKDEDASSSGDSTSDSDLDGDDDGPLRVVSLKDGKDVVFDTKTGETVKTRKGETLTAAAKRQRRELRAKEKEEE
jgi:hypothetical protein